MESWFFDERAHAGPEHLDAAYVADYDAKAGVDPAADLAVLIELGLNDSSTLLDFGAGTGALALAAATICRRVVAIDISPAMLDRLRRRAADLDLSNVEVVRAGFLTYQHQGEPADFAYSRHALHHLPDFWKAIALQRIAATLRPGGFLYVRDLIYSFDPSGAEAAIEAWLEGASGNPAAGWTESELATHVREEHSTFTWLLEPMLERAGFEIHTAEYSPSGIYASYVCVRR